MPPLTRNDGQRKLQVMVANPAMMARAVATGQQGGFSGQIPGTSSDPTQLAAQYSTIQQYPTATSLAASASSGDTSVSTVATIASGSYISIDTGSSQEANLTTGVSGSGPYTISLSQPLTFDHASSAAVAAPTRSPNGDQIAGVGHAVLNNDGNPVVVSGNLNAISGGASSNLPSSFQDGGFAFVDAAGNAVAGYSQPTGLFGFSTTPSIAPHPFVGLVGYGQHFSVGPEPILSSSYTITSDGNYQVQLNYFAYWYPFGTNTDHLGFAVPSFSRFTLASSEVYVQLIRADYSALGVFYAVPADNPAGDWGVNTGHHYPEYPDDAQILSPHDGYGTWSLGSFDYVTYYSFGGIYSGDGINEFLVSDTSVLTLVQVSAIMTFTPV